MSNSDEWVENYANVAPAFQFMRAGYDVWMGNNRGNSHSLYHNKYSPKDKEYYNYSFQEMGEYDLPAQIDKVLEVTGKKKLTYVAHSQGTSHDTPVRALHQIRRHKFYLPLKHMFKKRKVKTTNYRLYTVTLVCLLAGDRIVSNY